MARSLNANLRELWMNIHLWIGAGLLVVMIPLSISGALLVWHDPIERMVHAERFDVTDSDPTLPPSAYVAAAREAFGERAVPASLRFPAETGEPVTVVGPMLDAPPVNGRPPQLTAWLDPATAEVTDVANTRQSFFGVLHRLHGSLLIPNTGIEWLTGRKIVGWLGWAMTISCLTGLWLWWPRGGSPAKGLRWKRTPMVFDNLHHLLGFWVLVPLLVLSLTGIYISFPTTSRAVFGVEQAAGQRPGGGGGGRGGAPAAPLTATALSIDAVLASARAEAPGASVVSVTLPTEGREPSWRVQLKAGDAPPANFTVAEADGVVSPDPSGGGRPQDPISQWMRNVHYGTDTPFLWQVLIFAGGVIPPVLSVTGLVMWLRRERRKAALRRLKAPAPAPIPAE